jgi:hypothetical protein
MAVPPLLINLFTPVVFPAVIDFSAPDGSEGELAGDRACRPDGIPLMPLGLIDGRVPLTRPFTLRVSVSHIAVVQRAQ